MFKVIYSVRWWLFGSKGFLECLCVYQKMPDHNSGKICVSLHIELNEKIFLVPQR